MKVLLIKDVYKLGRAGDVKKVADGFGRNYLIPQGLAVLATPGTLKQVDFIRSKAAARRTELNNEMSSIADTIRGKVFSFVSKAGETGKLYGSITTQMIAEAIAKQLNVQVNRHQIECEPIRALGEHKASIRLTVDLVPEITIVVHREGEMKQKAASLTTKPAAPVIEIEESQPVEESPSA
ncbi:MAG: 50S ribosomal protein L9 [Bellilinea sp.]|jgi:large subunit ribosomal protein L9